MARNHFEVAGTAQVPKVLDRSKGGAPAIRGRFQWFVGFIHRSDAVPSVARKLRRLDTGEEQVIVQDNTRELLLAELLGLKHMPGRWGHDAEDEFGNRFELKTSTKSGFGTGRDVSPRMIAEWRTRYWIFARGQNLKTGFRFEEVTFLSPGMLEGWFAYIESRFEPDAKLRVTVISMMKETLGAEDLARIEYLFNRGMTYNNPHISVAYVRKNGVELDLSDAARDLKRAVSANPIKR
jgi:Restriction endonuclease PvuII